MSLTDADAASGTSPSKSGGAGFRLPPISFLSRSNDIQPAISSIAPLTHRPIEEQQQQNVQRIAESENSQSLTSQGESTKDNNQEHQQSSLPAPRAHELYSDQPATVNGQQKEPSSTHVAVVPQEGRTDVELQHHNPQDGDKQEAQKLQHHHHHHHHHHHNSTNSHGHHHHHHHHRRHSHLRKTSPETTTEKLEVETRTESANKRVKGLTAHNREALDALLKDVYPERHHLGTIIYNPTTTWETLQIEQLHGLQEHDKQRLLDIQEDYIARIHEKYSSQEKSYIPVVPPLSEAYINCYLEVKIPYRFIKAFVEEFTAGRIQKRRELWGGVGGIYTDDSDILSVLCHLGLFDDNLDLTESNPSWTKADLVKPLNFNHDDDNVELLDLSVTLLLLPTLREYRGFYRNGLNSRTWLGDSPHDGLSFSVFSVKWETYVTSASDRNLSKLAQKENLLDKLAEQRIVLEGLGWKFSHRYYKELLDKYKREDTSAEPSEAQNGV